MILHLVLESVGTTKTTISLPLSYVFYVPNFPFNLLSIGKLTQSLNYSVAFFSNCVIQEIRKQRTIGTRCKQEVCITWRLVLIRFLVLASFLCEISVFGLVLKKKKLVS